MFDFIEPEFTVKPITSTEVTTDRREDTSKAELNDKLHGSDAYTDDGPMSPLSE